jgi:hypothetical protein
MVTTIKLFIEGGGNDNASLKSNCRRAFSCFLKKAGLEDRMLRIVASGSRNRAYRDYRTAIEHGERAFLLIDSEASVICPKQGEQGYDKEDVHTWKPWYHLERRTNESGQSVDNWKKPSNGNDTDCHLMVQMMETWFLADIDMLKDYYGKGFNENAMPKQKDIENISKEKVLHCLEAAAVQSKKETYDKGRDSFAILERINPQTVMQASPWASRFISILKEEMKKPENH